MVATCPTATTTAAPRSQEEITQTERAKANCSPCFADESHTITPIRQDNEQTSDVARHHAEIQRRRRHALHRPTSATVLAPRHVIQASLRPHWKENHG